MCPHCKQPPARRRPHAVVSEPGRPRPTRRRLPPFGHRDQAFALRQLPGGFARAPDGFRLLAGFALGRFFVRLATLHLTKNALALHLLFEDSESLFDIVVANEYLQNVSNRGGTPRGERLNLAKFEYRGCTRLSQGLRPCRVIADKGRTPWTTPRIRRSLHASRVYPTCAPKAAEIG